MEKIRDRSVVKRRPLSFMASDQLYTRLLEFMHKKKIKSRSTAIRQAVERMMRK